MSVSGEVERLNMARDSIRTKMQALGIANGTENLTALAEAVQVLSAAKSYDSTGQNTDGYMTQKAVTDALASADAVTGIKGNAETSYRKGNVNLTPDNIGALAKPTGTSGQLLGFTANNVVGAVDAPSSDVTGVKGNAESSYRKGNVNITPANIGAATSSDLSTTNGNITSLTTKVNGATSVSLLTLAAGSWSSSTTTNGGREWYTQTKTLSNVYTTACALTPCGSSLSTLPTADMETAWGNIRALLDDTNKRITFYASTKPTIALYCAAEGVS